MKISAVEAIPVTQPQDRHSRIAYLQSHPLNFLFVRVRADDGTYGYGEACDSFCCNYPLTVRAAIDEALSPLLLGEDPLQPDRLFSKMRKHTHRRLGDQGVIIQAISGVEIALWDLAGKVQGRSISELLGRIRNRIPIYASGTFLEDGPPEWHLDLYQPCLNRGIRAIKVRMGLDYRSDLKKLQRLRFLLGDGIEILVDGNGYFTVPVAIQISKALESLGVHLFEEPIPQYNRQGIAELVAKSAVPIAYGGQMFTVHDFQDCLSHRRADVIQPDAATCGGISEARKASLLAECFGVPVMPHAAAGPVALAANIHLAAAVGNVTMVEYSFPLSRIWNEALREPIFDLDAVQEGELLVPHLPGLGLVINDEVVSGPPYRQTQYFT